MVSFVDKFHNPSFSSIDVYVDKIMKSNDLEFSEIVKKLYKFLIVLLSYPTTTKKQFFGNVYIVNVDDVLNNET